MPGKPTITDLKGFGTGPSPAQTTGCIQPTIEIPVSRNASLYTTPTFFVDQGSVNLRPGAAEVGFTLRF